MKKKQFDEFLGGCQSLPHEVSIMNFVSSRAHEISAMTSSIEDPQQTKKKLVFQKLPVYMRRRVMSHNVKRLPRRLREAHLAQMTKAGNGKDLPSVNKRLSRKYRRRPHRLFSEYNRRQRNKIWLETHIWHAKRFHMVDKWGYKIASHPNDKCFRANYRAAAKYCLLQDISYYTCIEITGNENLLKTTLTAHCNPSTLTFAAKKYIEGSREGTLMFFKRDGYPYFPIGNVNFFWQPHQSNANITQTDTRTIWIWIHPAFYNDFLSEIVSSFEFKHSNIEENTSSTVHKFNYLYINDKGCKMTILRNELNRFRLYGTLTLNVLTNVLKVPSLNKLNISSYCNVLKNDEISEENITISKYLNTELGKKMWYINYYKEQENTKTFKKQEQLWQAFRSLGSPNYLPTNTIIGLTVLDPRFYLPEKRSKSNTEVMETFFQASPINQLINHCNCSPIWDAEIRHIVSNSCVPTNIINKLRSESLIPGTSNDKYYDEDIMAKIPILLIQKPGTITGFGSGIDIIIPTKWAMPFWLALLMQCVRVGGLQESKSIAFESLNPNAPDINDPDSSAYTKEALITKKELTEKYFRYPPNRRVNFVKVGISSPFFCDWKNLTKDWSGNENFYVLRNREVLLFLQKSINFVKSSNEKLLSQHMQSDIPNLDDFKNCLIRVQISMIEKGTPKKFAIICMPTFEDLKKFVSNKKWHGPVEKCHKDPNERIRTKLRKNHLILLKRLKRQRIQRKRTLKSNILKFLKESTDKLNEDKSILLVNKIISDQSVKMSQLYLPKRTEVRYSCDKEIMGYVTLGSFSYSQARGIGIGYITLPSLRKMIDERCNIVLVRNTQTRQYRLADLNILGV
ncbi:hypothetical protein PUN28_000084 [Cardiocondyla obscurior]|uniref:Uncharacterized protein n=4 Tax=Cardiocondyla obscurior TaxID=286306 RepID=A0AAW2GXP1_9HYME